MARSAKEEIFNRFIPQLLSRSEKRAKAKNFDFDIDASYLKSLWNKNNGKCALTDIEFRLSDTGFGDRNPFIPSIDRINRKKGYVRGNIRIVTVAVNMALFTWGDDVFDEIVKARHEKLNPTEASIESIELDEKLKKLNMKYFRDDLIRDFIKRGRTVISKGDIEHIFKLKRGWFKTRQANGMSIPPPFISKPTKKPGVSINKYDLLNTFDWFCDNKQTLKE